MADLFTLFDGSMGAGAAAGISRQSSDSFSGVSSENDLVATLASGSDSIDLLVDYSDFSNFVTFNSAESYVTVTADQILNSYPRDGTVDDVQSFLDSLDGYQRYFLSLWPSRTGHLRLNTGVSSSYVRIDDFGIQDGAARTSFVSPGTGSLSIQGWIDVSPLAGSNAASFVFQKTRRDNSDGCSVFVSGSSLFFSVVSGSTSTTASGSLTSMPMFFAAVLDRTAATGSVIVYTGTTGSYPALASSGTIVLGPRFDLASGSFYLGSGTLAGKSAVPFSGSMDSVSVWSSARGLVDMSGTYNRRFRSQSGLLGIWEFNDATPSTPTSYASIVRDSSGHRLDGRIQSFHSGVLGSGSLILDAPDPILSLDDPNVVSYVVRAQTSGTLYDRDNQSLIFNLFPESFSQTDPVSGDVFRNFALVLARHFDRIKTYVNQLANLRRVHYGDFDQAPDEILDHVARSFGWELGGGFSTTDAMRYFIGRGVRPGPSGNSGTALADVKAAFWRRVLLNLMYLYKTKGSRESVEALLRIYGVDNGFVRLKEYARKAESTMPLSRVTAEKSVYSMRFSSGSNVSLSFDVPPVVIPSAGLVLIMGDSNGVGQADTDKFDRGLNTVVPFTGVLNNARYAVAVTDPPIFVTVTSSFLAPYAAGGGPGAGIELTLGRELHRVAANPYVIKFAINGTTALDYSPTGSYPSTGGNLSTRLKAYINEMQVSSSLPLKAVFLSLCTNDANTSSVTGSYSGSMKAIMNDLRSSYGSDLVFVLPRLNVAANVLFGSTIRSVQEAIAASDPLKTRLLNQDDLPMASDGLHYLSDSYAAIGQRTARKISDMLSISQRSIGTAYPQWVGADAGFAGTGTLFPRSWAGQANGDREFLVVTTGLGTNPISLLSSQGFTLVTGTTSNFVGLIEAVNLYTRTVQSSSFVSGIMPTPVVSGANAFNSSRIHSFRGPLTTSSIDSFSVGRNDGFGTSFTMASITGSFSNELFASFLAGYSGNGLNSSSMTNPAVTDFEQGRDSIFTIGSDYQMNALSVGFLAGSGAITGTVVATPFNSIMAGITVLLKPS